MPAGVGRLTRPPWGCLGYHIFIHRGRPCRCELLQNRPDLRLALAVHRYQIDESVSLAGAAAVAGVSSEQMKEILVSRGVQLRLGPANLAEAQAEVTAVEEWLNEHFACNRLALTD